MGMQKGGGDQNIRFALDMEQAGSAELEGRRLAAGSV